MAGFINESSVLLMISDFRIEKPLLLAGGYTYSAIFQVLLV
jgi:hypothetical protein